MGKGIAGAVAVWLVAAGLAVAQPVPAPPEAPAASPGPTEEWFWFRTDSLLTWFKRDRVAIPLITSGGPTATGAIGDPATSVVFGGPGAQLGGGASLDREPFYAVRFALGHWFNLENTCGLEVVGTAWIGRSDNFLASTVNQPNLVLARPFFNAVSQMEDAFIVAFPQLPLVGAIHVFNNTDLWSPEVNLRWLLYGRDHLRVDGLLGFRYMELQENLIISNASAFGPIFIGISDQFDTRDRFYGGQLGAQADYVLGHFFVNLLSQVAVGGTQQLVNIKGTSNTSIPGFSPMGAASSGLLALAGSNAGRTTHDAIGVVPEVELKLGWQFGKFARLSVGYSFLYWNSVVRPAEQLDRVVNPNLVPLSGSFGAPGGPGVPAAPFRRTDFWAQGLLFGLELTY